MTTHRCMGGGLYQRPEGRGLCPVCRIEYQLRKDGTIRRHYRGPRSASPRESCPSSGQPPKAEP